MKIINRYNIIAGVLLTLTIITGCERTELCYDHYPKASLTFGWEREWERDYGLSQQSAWDAGRYGYQYDDLRPAMPEWVNMVRYRHDQPDGEHYMSPYGGDLVMADQEGLSFLLYNGDTEYIILSDIASIPDARASASPRSRSTINYVMERHPGTRMANPPDILYGAYIETVPTIASHETRHIPVLLQPLVYTYLIRYEFEYGREHVYLARGALGGMAESVFLRDGRTSEESTIVLYDCELKDYGCEARVRSFGAPAFPDEYYGRADETADRPYTLNLEVMLTNGTTKEFNFNIDEQLRKQPRGGIITVSGIRIEDEDNETPMHPGGFDVGLSGWSEVDVDLPVNP